MTTSFEVVKASEPSGRQKWLAAWEALPVERRDVYFHPGYLEALEMIGRGRATCAMAAAGDARWLYPFLEVPIDSNAAGREIFDIQSGYGYGGPVVNAAGELSSFIHDVWEQFDTWSAAEGIVAEFVRFHPLLDNRRWAPRAMSIVHNRTTVVADAQSYPDAVWKDPQFRVQRHMVRRAEREGYSFEILPFDGDLRWFSDLYDLTHERLAGGSETRFPLEYFEALRDQFRGRAWLGVVREQSEILVAALVLNSEAFAHCHLMGYRRARLTNGSTNLVYHGIYLEAARRGLSLVHMGGGTSGAPDDALLKFKSSLSPLMREFFIGKLVRDENAWLALERQCRAAGRERPPGFFLFYRAEVPLGETADQLSE
jgi:hypothetical protein